MAFTSWQDLANQIKDSIADGNVLVREYEMNDRKIKFRSWAEVWDFLKEVEKKAEIDNGFTGFVTTSPVIKHGFGHEGHHNV